MFPNSGVPASDAINTLPDVTSVPCDELWYSTSRCQPRFDPAAANAMLAEDMNLIMKGEVQYDCLKLDNIERAVRYINQRGLPQAAYLTGGPQNYLTVLDPPVTRYNDYMVLTIVPAVSNTGAVTIDAGRGAAYLLRNDGKHLEKDDLIQGRPSIIVFYSGYWFMCGLASSQVLLRSPALDFWIRTDGNDATGDGTANDPAKAFRTIAGCWAAVGSRYAATPGFAINMRLGIGGVYDGASIGPFGGRVSLTGDANNPRGYHLRNYDPIGNGGEWTSLLVGGISAFTVSGVTFRVSQPGSCYGLRVQDSECAAYMCVWETMIHNPSSAFIFLSQGSFGTNDSVLTFYGNGGQMGYLIIANEGSNFFGARQVAVRSTYHFNDVSLANTGLALGGGSLIGWSACNLVSTNVTGNQYMVTANSVLTMAGQLPPGTIAGTTNSGGQFIP